MKNLLIVESENDKYFIEALINYMKISNIKVSNGTICRIDDYECMEGLSETKLTEVFNAAVNQAKKKGVKRLGIVIDQDDKSIAERIGLVNKVIANSLNIENVLQDTGKLYSIPFNNRKIDIGLCLTNVNGKGELETVLKAIKIGTSIYADCLKSWQDCLVKNGINGSKGIKQKDFDKFWVQVFIRFDACSKKDQKQAGRKCNTQISMNKPLWNFGAECLSEMRQFLKFFSE